jgi:hypothetical protein
MPIEDKSKTPSVKLWLDGCEERGSLLVPDAVNFVMRVAGTADNQATFEKIKKKFSEGFELHTIDDFKTHMIKALREDNTSYEQRIRDLETQLMNERKEKLALKEQIKSERETLDFFRRKA